MTSMAENVQADHRHVRQFQRMFVHLCRAAQGRYDQKPGEQQERRYQPQQVSKLSSTGSSGSAYALEHQLLLPASPLLLSFRPRGLETKEGQDAAVATALEHYHQIQDKRLREAEQQLKHVEEKHRLLSLQPNINKDQLKKIELMISSLHRMIETMRKK
ncbi:hypothetical protein HYS47_02615 [Candidatus Woesearchaeota archaeon]|nr:hypothetical protein [Candidatus Woesearchaeota archaeon]